MIEYVFYATLFVSGIDFLSLPLLISNFSPFGKRKCLKIARIGDEHLDKYLKSYKEKANKINL